MPHVCILFFLLHVLRFRQSMRAAGIHPMRPAGRVLGQHFASQNAVAGSILDVDVEVMAVHGYYDVEVDLHLVGDTLFNGEELGFMASVPAEEFSYGEKDGDEYEGEGGVAAGGGATGVGWLSFGCN